MIGRKGMQRISLVNRTDYNSRDLRAIFAAVLKQYHRSHAKPERVNVVCEYRRKRDGFCGGYGWYDSYRMKIMLPKEPKDLVYAGIVVLKAEERVSQSNGDYTLVQRVARTFHHELDHLRGLRHSEMKPDRKRELPDLTGFQLRHRAPKKEAEVDRSPDAKIERLRARMKRWESKKKRAETAIKTITRKIRYYERRAAATPPPATPEV